MKNSTQSLFEGVDLSNIEKLMGELEDFRKQIAGGLLDELLHIDSDQEYESLKEFLNGDFDPDILRQKIEIAVEKMVRGRCTLKDAFGLTPEGMESFYFIGYSMFQKRNYPAARRVFDLLLQLDPLEARYYHALASTQHKQKDFFAAVRNYTMAFTHSAVSDPELYFHCADCYLKMDDLMSAIISLGHCIEACDERRDLHKQIKARSVTLREIMISNLAEQERKKEALHREQEIAKKLALEKAETIQPTNTPS